jgi:nucleotide-binding universal stress UspA family protein
MMTRAKTGTVLCATDLTKAGDEALRQADEAARARKSRLVVLHVLQDPLRHHPLLPLARKLRYARVPEAQARSADDVRAQVERTIGARTPVEIQIEHGLPHAAIIERAEALRVELVVVGASRSQIGHQAERVVRYAHCPVLVARPSPAAGAVLAATDLSDAALPAVAAGVEHARRHRSPLVLLHVVDLTALMTQPDFTVATAVPLTDELRESLLESARDRLEKALKRHRAKGKLIVETGSPAVAILNQASLLPARLLVLGTAGTTGLKRMVLGSVAESVVRRALCSTLVVRLHAAGTRRPR